MKRNDTTTLIIKSALIMAVFYMAVFIAWNTTSKEHKPSTLFWDMRKEGYRENPLYDRIKGN